MSEQKLFILTAHGAQRFSTCFEKDFWINFNNDFHLNIPKCSGCFFSSKISKSLIIDPTTKQFSIKLTENPTEEEKKIVENIFSGNEIEINKENSSFLFEIGELIAPLEAELRRLCDIVTEKQAEIDRLQNLVHEECEERNKLLSLLKAKQNSS